MALGLFAASSLLVELIARAAALAFGAPPSSIADLCRWDCKWYAKVASSGYQLVPNADFRGYANWAFFPALPLIAKSLALLLHVSLALALVLASKAAFLVCIWAFMLLIRAEIDERAALLGGAVIAFNPYLLYAHVGYSESLYFALTTLVLLATHQKRWVLAGLFGAALSATRVVGLLIAIPYLVRAFQNRKHAREEWPRMLLGLLLIPAGVIAFAVHLHVRMGDGLAFEHVQVAWGRSLGNPFEVLWIGLHGGQWDTVFALVGIMSLAMAAWLLFRREFDYGVLLLATTLMPISAGLMSLPRFIFWQLPFVYGIVSLLHGRRWMQFAYFAFAGGAASFMLLGWFLGKSFVI